MKAINEKSNFIILRNTKESDLDFVVNSERNPENAKYIGQWTKEQHKDSLFQEDILHLIVEEKATNKPIGYVILAGITNKNKSIEFRRIVISSKGKGLGRETLKLVKKVAFENLHAHRLWLDVRYKNQRAQRLYKSEGFVEEGILRECILYDQNYESLIVMSILKNEYTSELNS
ncbi:GNAT family N-acetyltransferase [Clostridium sp. YIM B02505]|uniref:GNAT family N-acetyltransferase n=1 Tax=Clostridium yunnanense TaxID=2800325 RepID=A0ABS1EV40_9CLOT|nr:GNAT family protein [Clostridium yunnanense]MBK1813236.1 GNAT family N-acetyltransferase [Clostridium yunnanense]